MKMRSKVAICCLFWLGMATVFVFAADTMKRHPIGNRKDKSGSAAKVQSWQIEYDKDHPRSFESANPANKTYAVRLIVPRFNNAGVGGVVDVSDDDKSPELYLYKGVDVIANKYLPLEQDPVPPMTEPLKAIKMTGWVTEAPEAVSGTKSYWKKAHLTLRLRGKYVKDGNTFIVVVVGSFHAGHKNKDGEGNRGDHRLVLNVYERKQDAALKEAYDKFELQLKDKNKPGYSLEAFKEFFKAMLAGDPCENMEPGDAAMEAPLDDPTDPTVFTYAPELP